MSKHYTHHEPLTETPITDTPLSMFHKYNQATSPKQMEKCIHFDSDRLYNATRYEKASSLTSIDETNIAGALFDIYIWIGLPEQILTECGLQFTGKLMTDMFQISNHYTSHNDPLSPPVQWPC